MTEKENPEENTEGNFDDMKKEELICKVCGEKNAPQNLFCVHCGHHFIDKIPCRNCQKEVPIINTFCSFCGAPIRAINREQSMLHENITPQQGFIAYPHSGYSSQRVQVTPEMQMMLYKKQQEAKIQTRKTSAKVIGILSLVIVGIMLIITIFFVSSLKNLLESESAVIYGLDEFEYPYILGVILSLFLPIIVIFSSMGISLLKPKNPDRPWKSLYHTFRYVFLGITAFIILLSILMCFAWLFYNPSYINTQEKNFWMFKIFPITLNMNIAYLYLITLAIFMLCVFMLILPAVIKRYKGAAKKSANTIEKKELITEEKKPLSQHPAFGSKPKIIFTNKNDIFVEMKKRKGPMLAIFYSLKGMPLIKSMEILGASLVVSFIIIFILSPFVEETGGVEMAPYDLIFHLAWAGIFEEISFRLILISGPMIVVMLVRLYLQMNYKKKQKEQHSSSSSSYLNKSLQNQPTLGKRDVLLAIRGKYQIIGIPEWVLVGISSFLFGFAHWKGWTGGWGAWKIVQAGMIGFFLGYAFVKYGIEAAIFIHITNNVISSLSVVSVGIPGTNWLQFFSAISIFVILLIGLMKGISFIINLVYRYHIINYPHEGS